MEELKFIEKRIEEQRAYIRALDVRVHSYKTKRYYELRESAAGVLMHLWERKKKLKTLK
jgi:hypothetical protein